MAQKLNVDGVGIVAQEEEANAAAAAGGGTVFFASLLEHERRASADKAAPGNFPLRFPFFGNREAELVAIEGQRPLNVLDEEERDQVVDGGGPLSDGHGCLRRVDGVGTGSPR